MDAKFTKKDHRCQRDGGIFLIVIRGFEQLLFLGVRQRGGVQPLGGGGRVGAKPVSRNVFNGTVALVFIGDGRDEGDGEVRILIGQAVDVFLHGGLFRRVVGQGGQPQSGGRRIIFRPGGDHPGEGFVARVAAERRSRPRRRCRRIVLRPFRNDGSRRRVLGIAGGQGRKPDWPHPAANFVPGR